MRSMTGRRLGFPSLLRAFRGNLPRFRARLMGFPKEAGAEGEEGAEPVCVTC